MASEAPWYVICVRSGMEKLSMKELCKLAGVEAFTPMGIREQRRARGQSVYEWPILSKYVFVRADLGNAATCVTVLQKKVKGRFVRRCGKIDTVTHAEVQRFMDAEAAGKWDEITTAAKRLAGMIGKCVVLTDGPLEGFTVTVTDIEPNGTMKAFGQLGSREFKTVVKPTLEMLKL